MSYLERSWFPLCVFLSSFIVLLFFVREKNFPVIPNKNTAGVVKETKKAFDGYYISYCNVHDGNEVILDYQGSYCNFMPDGNFVTHTGEALLLYNPEQEILWKKDFFGHHDLAFDYERREIATLTGWPSPVFTRSHGFLIHDFSGNEIFRWNLEDHADELQAIVGYDLKADYKRLEVGDRNEIWFNDPSHSYLKINSVHIIQKTPLYPKNDFFKPGNILINIQAQQIIAVVDRDSSKIVWSYKVGGSSHSAKLTDRGTLVYFENRTGEKILKPWEKFLALSMYYPMARVGQGGKVKINQQPHAYYHIYFSRIVEYSIDENKEIWSYSYPYRFYSSVMGNIQLLPNGHFLITHVTHGGSAFELNREKEILWEWVNPDWDNDIKGPAPIFQVLKVEKKRVEPALRNNF